MKRAMWLAAAVCAAMFVLPAVASAGVWHIQNGTLGFSGEGGTGQLTRPEGQNIHCTHAVVKGAYENTTTGWVKFTFHGCTGPLGVSCTTAGQSSGTITTTKLTFHNVLLAGNQPGLLITPSDEGSGNHFASFTCFGITMVVTGNGLLGRLNKECNAKSPHATATFASSEPGVPNPTRVTGLGKEYTLESSIGGGAPVMASEDASVTMNFAGEVEQEFDCTGV